MTRKHQTKLPNWPASTRQTPFICRKPCLQGCPPSSPLQPQLWEREDGFELAQQYQKWGINYLLKPACLLVAIRPTLSSFIRYSPPHTRCSPDLIPESHLILWPWLLTWARWPIQESQIKTSPSLKCQLIALCVLHVILFLSASNEVTYSCVFWQSQVITFVFPEDSVHLLCSVFPSLIKWD